MQDSQGIPQIERDLLQVEQLSQKLKARTARIDSGSQTLAATRLLAQEGLNSRKCEPLAHHWCLDDFRISVHASWIDAVRAHFHSLFCMHRLTRALQTFELRPTYEDVLPVESTSVEEYLEQMHELTTITAIQVCLRLNNLPEQALLHACGWHLWHLMSPRKYPECFHRKLKGIPSAHLRSTWTRA